MVSGPVLVCACTPVFTLVATGSGTTECIQFQEHELLAVSEPCVVAGVYPRSTSSRRHVLSHCSPPDKRAATARDRLRQRMTSGLPRNSSDADSFESDSGNGQSVQQGSKGDSEGVVLEPITKKYLGNLSKVITLR